MFQEHKTYFFIIYTGFLRTTEDKSLELNAF